MYLRPMPLLSDQDIERFWNKVSASDSGCWIWLGHAADKRYGFFKVNNQSYIASRIAYYIEYDIDPGNKLVCHECNNTFCVNPEHLYLDNQSGNMKKAYDENRKSNKGENHPCSRLNELQVKQIKTLLLTTEMTHKEIAQEFGVSKSTIDMININKIWKEVR